MFSRQKLTLATFAWVATCAVALAADGEPLRNEWAMALQRQLLRWGIWYAGVHRIDDGAFFGLVCCIILTSFLASAFGLVMFKAGGLSFTAGWMLSLPLCFVSMFAYAYFRPYPTADDLASMFFFAGTASVAALALCYKMTGAAVETIKREPSPKHKKAQTDSRLDQRMRLVTRTSRTSA